MERALHRTEYHDVRFHRADGVVRMERSDVPFPSIAAMEAEMAALARVLDELGREGWGLLIDTRRAPPRNDAAYERAFEPWRTRVMGGFRRVAVVAATATGRLQVARYAREDGGSARVFADEHEAWGFLLAGGS